MAAAADDFGPHTAGQSVYDRASVLSSSDAARLQAHIGSRPYVVFFRLKGATAAETESDARALMDAWTVESTPGARDGAVVFVNFDPANVQHGQVAIYAGQSLNLSRGRLTSITDSMTPALRAGHYEQAAEQAIDALTLAPASPAAESGPPFNIVALFLGGLSVLFLIPLIIIAWAAWLIFRNAGSGRRSPWTSNSSSSFSSSSSSSSTSDGGSSGSSSF